MSTDDRTYYRLEFRGPVPRNCWYRDMDVAKRARRKARRKGYHVTLFVEQLK